MLTTEEIERVLATEDFNDLVMVEESDEDIRLYMGKDFLMDLMELEQGNTSGSNCCTAHYCTNPNNNDCQV
jgi:hypothetical protein